MGNKWAVKIRHRVHGQAESLGNLCVESFHFLALFAIGAITAWASVVAFLGMVEKGNVTVDDILLLFIYLELGAMTGIYFKAKVHVSNIPLSAYQMLKSPDNAGALCA
ncbi:Phosphate-starvation-inducible E [Pseudomonas amygdali pv. mori]|uniref:Protein PsiE n=1 Tax=Pseudomonas amygdali pv. mori TaxID=34065 RepID=A0A3M5J3S8_PSEA0|nr:PsiE protein [Pseudomonas amygdali pv. mori]RMR38625.1 Phosphate-starvation-inducible E [Pseudomonas amygdali pv. mori]RMT17590.1 Phosphate-starvation-inducible E [Pseudomonas amygdali pv. mori]